MSILRLLPLVLLAGCASVDYVGKTYPPTARVDLYMSADDVQRPYEVMGEARAQIDAIPFSNPGSRLQEELLAEARAKGANGVILGPLDTRTVGSTSHTTGQGEQHWHKGKKHTQHQATTTTSDDEVTELRGQLIRYR